MRHAFVSIAILCSGVTHAQDVVPEDAGAREGRLEPAREFTSADKWFKASVPAKPGEVRKTGNSYLVTLDIGGESPIVCEVTPGGIKLAEALRRGFDTWLKEAEAARDRRRLSKRPMRARSAIFPFWQFAGSTAPVH